MQTKNKTLLYLISGGIALIVATALFIVFFFQPITGVSPDPGSEKIAIQNNLFTAIISHKDFKGTAPEPPAYGRQNPFAPHN